MLFDDKLKQLYEIYQEQTSTPNNLETLDDDDIMEFLLTIEAKVFYNGKKNVISISLSHGRYFRQFWGTATFTSESLHTARCNSLYL